MKYKIGDILVDFRNHIFVVRNLNDVVKEYFLLNLDNHYSSGLLLDRDYVEDIRNFRLDENVIIDKLLAKYSH